MHEQLRIYREELAKKDHLITELTRVETPRPRMTAAVSTTAVCQTLLTHKVLNF